MEEMDQLAIEDSEKRRPRFLLVLCILSFVYIGWALISGVISLMAGPMNEEEVLTFRVELTKQMSEMRELGADGVALFFEKILHMVESTNASHYAFGASNLFILGIGLLGTIWMLRGRKLGFHFYIIYSLLASVHLYFFVSAAYVPTMLIVFNILISGLFIFMYSRNLHWMK